MHTKIIIGSDNGLAPLRRQAIIWTNDGYKAFCFDSFIPYLEWKHMSMQKYTNQNSNEWE